MEFLPLNFDLELGVAWIIYVLTGITFNGVSLWSLAVAVIMGWIVFAWLRVWYRIILQAVYMDAVLD